MTSENLKEVEEWQKQRRIDLQVRAFMDRAVHAKIPKKYMCVKDSAFKNLLDDKFYPTEQDKIKQTFMVYKQPAKLMSVPFIIIDGGDQFSRQKAGCAILFRMITCDNFGLYEPACDLIPIINDIKSDRNEYVSTLDGGEKKILFIHDFYAKDGELKDYSGGGTFLDKIFQTRYDKDLPTIISLKRTVKDTKKDLGAENVCGTFFPTIIDRAMQVDDCSKNPSDMILRIRVK